uniref:Uncharacterized protein n=1 Tax=Avena sativa TaxID=4498 RepID=A0ACD5W425_AVESA
MGMFPAFPASVGADPTRSSSSFHLPSTLSLGYISLTFIDLPLHTGRIKKKVIVYKLLSSYRSIHRSMDIDSGMEMEKPSPLHRSLSTVTYCCGRCGYDLKLSSLARDTAGMVGAGARIGCGRPGTAVVVFDAIDDARFGHLDEFRCLDVRARRLFARRTRLLCRKCGAHVGFGYDDSTAATRPPRYHIKIRALHPAASPDETAADATPLRP